MYNLSHYLFKKNYNCKLIENSTFRYVYSAEELPAKWKQIIKQEIFFWNKTNQITGSTALPVGGAKQI